MPDQRKNTLLYVDDEPALLELGKIFLEFTGEFVVQTASSVLEGIEALRCRSFDAVVSDYQMPEIDGISFLKQVRSLFGDLPFILFTGRGREDVVIEAIKNGADFYLQKGGEPRPQFSELTNQIRQAIRRRRAEISLRESEERFRGMAERSSDLILVCDPDLRITYVSPSSTKILGLDPAELIGVRAEDSVFFPGDFERFQEAVAKMPDHSQTGVELRMMKKDSSWVVVSMRGSAIIRDGIKSGVQVQGRDITDQKRAEEALARSERRLRALFSAMTDQILTLDYEGRFQEVAPTSPDLIHRIPDAYLGKTVHEVFPQNLADQFLRGIRQTLTTGRTTPLEYSLTIAGTWHWYTALISRLSKKTVLFVSRDVTDQKNGEESLKAAYEEIAASEEEIRQQYDSLTKSEMALRNSEEAYRTIFEHTGTAMVQVGSDLAISLVNGTFEDITGYSRDELEGKRYLTDFVVPGDRARVLAYHRAISAPLRQNPLQYEFRFVRQDGGERSILSTVGVLPQTGQAVASLVDITAIKNLEGELRASEERFRMLFEHAPVAYHSLNPEGRLIAVNQAWLDEMGYTREEVIGHPFSELVVESSREHFKNLFSRLVDRRQIRGNEYQLIRRDGTQFLALCEVTAAYGRNMGLKQVHCMIINRSERMQVEQALRQANRQLNLMTSVTRHDILNQIMVIQAYLDLLDEEVRPEGTSTILTKLNGATGAIKNQIEFTRVYRDLGYHPPHWHPLVDLLPTQDLPENIRFTTSVEGIEVFADQLMAKVFFNLLDNAMRHGERVTEIRFSAGRQRENLVLSWEDDGVGVPVREKERIFERGVGKNTGLGLFLVREILAITGITIREAGTPGVGARFLITVPKGSFRFIETD
ncbi:response regulator [Methanosphaerula palustris]|uniref:histidine kinase n=1 Tax=Methanosphaerula palustris (strain ATCC BAA-1556 / DSM 19958 / E1-9c) TaxID=521011 RepID=B8GJB1_METPE|nr:PAS domain S-box protein [Methanosphaerula palustris]ACL16952.1 multi-sensor signal transduction histidine kinase [Methanosphaerula palustris E1-9c]